MRLFAYVVAAISLTGSLLVAGCGTGGITGPGLNAVKVTITSPSSSQTLQAGQTVNITASVTNAKYDQGVSWSVSGSGTSGGTLSNPTLTSVTYNAPANVSANTTVIVTATSVANPSMSASISITISAATTNNSSLFSGQYTFLVSGNGSAVAASITADGNGAITGGEEDIVSPATSKSTSGVAITGGSYTVGADNRGTLTYTDANSNSFTFALALSGGQEGVATRGQMVEFDTNPLQMTGSLSLQQSWAFNLPNRTEHYAFGLPGWDASSAPLVSAGSFVVFGSSGNIHGVLDQNDNGTLTSDASYNGSLSSIDSNGRATLKIVASNSILGLKIDGTYAIYVASPDRWFAIGTGLNGGESSGQIRRKSEHYFDNGSLNGNAIFELQSETAVPSPNAELGLMTFDGNGNDTYSLDQDAGGGADVTSSGTLTYDISPSPEGRFTLSGEGVGYMIGRNEAFIVGETTGTQVGFGMLEPQWNETYSNSSLQGSFYFGTDALVGPYAPSVNYQAPPSLIYSSGILTLDGTTDDKGNGNVAGTVDANDFGLLLTSGVPLTDTYSVAANGRATTGSGSEVIYIASPTKFYYLTIPSGTAGNPTIGVGEQIQQQQEDGVRQP